MKNAYVFKDSSWAQDFGDRVAPVKRFGDAKLAAGVWFLFICCPAFDAAFSFHRNWGHNTVRGLSIDANMILLHCNSDVRISLACSMWAGNCPSEGNTETASLGELDGPRICRQQV